jgi:hypothetical protein
MAEISKRTTKISLNSRNVEEGQHIIQDLLSKDDELNLMISNYISDLTTFNKNNLIHIHPNDLIKYPGSITKTISAGWKTLSDKKIRRLYRLSVELNAAISVEVNKIISIIIEKL